MAAVQAAAASTSPTRATPRARCCSTFGAAAWDPSCSSCSACPSASLPRGARRAAASSGARATSRPRGARLRRGGRPAGGALRPALPRAGPRQEHVRHRLVRADQPGHQRAAADRGPALDRRLADRPADHVRARGRDLRHRRRRPVAARRPADHRGGRRDRGAGGLAGLQRRRLLRARPDRAGLAALGSRTRAGRSSGSRAGTAARTSRAPRSRRWPTRRSTPCARWSRRQRAAGRAARRRRGDRQPLADAVPGRRARRARGGARRSPRRRRWAPRCWRASAPGCSRSTR